MLALVNLHKLSPGQARVYLLGSLIILAVSAVAFVRGYQNRAGFGTMAVLWYLQIFQSSLGQQYFAHYFAGYVEAVVVVSFLIPCTPVQMLTLQGTGFLIFLTSAFFSPVRFLEPDPGQLLLDIFLAVIVAHILGTLAYVFIVNERRKKEEFFRKCADAGRYSSMVLHDVKNLITTPGLTAELLKKKLLEHPDPQVQLFVNTISSDMKRVRDYIFEFEQVIFGSEDQAPVKLGDLVHGVRMILNSKIGKVQLQCHSPDVVFNVKRRCLARALMNIITNSLDALSAAGVQNPAIHIRVEGSSITVSDNGPGIPFEIIKKIQMGETASNKEAGTGLGVMIIKENLEEMGGSAQFANGPDGAQVTLRLPSESRSS